MAFRVPDLIIESILRDGFTAVRRDKTIVDDVFADLDLGFTKKKYGQKELNRLKKFLTEKEVSIVQAFSQVPTNMPCISIQLVSSSEAKNYTILDDFASDKEQDLSPKEEEQRVILDIVYASDYDPMTGIVSVSNVTDLEPVIKNNLYVDASGTEFSIRGGINNATGKKQFNIGKNQDPDLSEPGKIISSIDFKQFEERATVDNERILLGIHTEERLLTIYMYILVKYFLLSRKRYLIERGFQLASYDASDFTRNLDYKEPVFSRFITVSGITTHEWLSDKVEPLESIDVIETVAKDVANTEEAELDNMTIQIDEEHNQDDE